MTPAQIAREALRRLAAERRIPSPENYGEIYNDIAGKNDGDSQARSQDYQLRITANSLLVNGAHADAAARLTTACADRTWPAARDALVALAQALQIERHAEEAQSLRLAAPPGSQRPPGQPVHPGPGVLRDLLVRLLESGFIAHLSEHDDLMLEGRVLAGRVRAAADDAALAVVTHDLSRYCTRLEERAAGLASLRDGLVRLLRLLVDNTSELIVEDTWVRHQLDLVREIVLQRPADQEAIDEAESFLREALKRQGEFKRGLREARDSLREMATTFATHLSAMVQDTGDFNGAVENHVKTLQSAQDMATLKSAIDALVRDTLDLHRRTGERHREFTRTRERALAAEARVKALEEDLARTSQRLIEDHLTGTLNRRGFEDGYSREAARAERSGKPLAIAMLDVDDFKAMNDRYGHNAGDEALAHLAAVIKKTVRPSDVVARYGGEEFLILLPDTDLARAEALVSRLQRELTRHFFLHNNERLLMTFSAGVTQWLPGEDQASLVARADAALYQAKKNGKNKVVVTAAARHAAVG